MEYLVLVLSVFLALFGVYLMLEFLWINVLWNKTQGVVRGFQEKTKWGKALPIVSYNLKSNNAEVKDEQKKKSVSARVVRVDRLAAHFDPLQEGDIVPVIFRFASPKRVYVFGFLNLILGGMLCLPLLTILVLNYGQAIMMYQLLFVFVFIAVMFGAWLLMKLVQKGY